MDGGLVQASEVGDATGRLKLRVNRDKSVVDRATKRPLLGSASSIGTVRSRCGCGWTGRPRQRAKRRLGRLTAPNSGSR
jgi:hypothetical protein